MTDGGASVENGRPEPTEVSPLLGRDIDDHAASNGQNGGINGSSHAHASAENGNGNHGGDGAGDQEEGPVSKTTPKLHFLLPALAIGIFLSALDQTLIIATYAKMSSDLHALNRTSWISTA